LSALAAHLNEPCTDKSGGSGDEKASHDAVQLNAFPTFFRFARRGRTPKKTSDGTLFTWERLDRVDELKKAVKRG
jgi:hypothetical protein